MSQENLNSSKALENVLQNTQSTHSSPLNYSIGLLLWKLKNRYGTNELSQIANAFFEDIKFEIISNVGPDVYDYIKMRFEDPSIKSKISFYLNEKWHHENFSLKEVFYLVYRALTDESQYTVNQDNYFTANENRAFRLKTLWATLIHLFEKEHGNCLTGMMHQLGLTLNGVYPNVQVIEDFDLFLNYAVQDYFNDILKEIQKENLTLCLEILLIESNRDLNRHPAFQEKINQSLSRLNNIIQESCKKNGINPNEIPFVKKIANTLNPDVLKDVGLWIAVKGGDSILFVLKELLDQVPNKAVNVRDQALIDFQDYIFSDLLNYSDDAPLIKDFYKIDSVYRLFEKHHQGIHIWNNNYCTVEEIKFFKENFDIYHQSCSKNFGFPLPLSVEFSEALDRFSVVCAAYLKDKEVVQITNFFALLNLATEQDRPRLIQSLYELKEAGKLLLNDHFLEEVLSKVEQESSNTYILNIDLYVMNRVLLHALFSPPHEWTHLFVASFTSILSLLKKLGEDNIRHKVIKETSFPEHILNSYSNVLNYGKYIRGEKNFEEGNYFREFLFFLYRMLPASKFVFHLNDYFSPKDFQVLIRNVGDFLILISFIPHLEHEDFIKQNFSKTFIAKLIQNMNDFKALMLPMRSHEAFKFFKEYFTIEHIYGLIKTARDFHSFFICFDEKKKLLERSFTHSFMLTLVQSPDDFQIVITCLSKEYAYEFLMTLDRDFVQNLIENGGDLCTILGFFSGKHQRDLISKHFDKDFIQSKIKDMEHFRKLALSISQLPRFISILDIDFIESFFNDVSDFLYFFGSVPSDILDCFNFDKAFIQSKINTIKDLQLITIFSSAEAKQNFLTQNFDKNFFQDRITNIKDLKLFFSLIPTEDTLFAGCLDKAFVQDQLCNANTLNNFVYSIQSNHKTIFIETYLDKAFIQRIINTPSDLNDFLWNVSDYLRFDFIEKNFDKEFIAQSFCDVLEFEKLLSKIPIEQTSAFIEIYFSKEFIVQNYSDVSRLRKLLLKIDQDHRELFVRDYFDSDFIEKLDEKTRNLFIDDRNIYSGIIKPLRFYTSPPPFPNFKSDFFGDSPSIDFEKYRSISIEEREKRIKTAKEKLNEHRAKLSQIDNLKNKNKFFNDNLRNSIEMKWWPGQLDKKL